MKVIATKTLNLIPIGNINFSFTKRKNRLYIGDIDIMCNTDVHITPEEEKAFHKLMKAEKSELLTDGHVFYTTRGTILTQIKHPSFDGLLSHPDNKEKIHNLLYR